MDVLKLAGSVVALIVAILFTIIFPGSGIEQIVVLVAGSIFTYFGWDWRIQYLEVKNWVASKTLISIIIVAVPVAGFLVSLVFSFDLTTIQVLGFSLETIFQWLIGIGGGGFLLGATHAKVKKNQIYKKAA